MHKSKLIMLANFRALRRLSFVFRATPRHLSFSPQKPIEGCTYLTWPTYSSGYVGPGPFSWDPPSTTRFAFWSHQMGRPESLLTSFLYTTFFTQTEPAVKMLASRLISDKLKCSGLPGTGWSTSVFSKIRGIKCTNKTQHIGSNLCEATKICGFCRKLFPRPNWEKKNANKFLKMF